MRGVAEAEQRRRRRARRAQRVLEDRQRRDADAAADEQRAAAVLRRREAAARAGPSTHSAVARAQLAQPLGARADVLEQELRARRRAVARDREGARQERPLVLPAAPALGGGEHAELARPRARDRRGRRREHAVGAELAARRDGQQAPAPSGARTRPSAPRLALTRGASARAGARAVELLQGEHLGLAARARAAIARAAASPPDERRQARDRRARRRAADLASRRCARRSRSAC